MIKVENVFKNYGEHKALKGISYTINKGEIVGFLGPNGAGKSTMMRIITGYLPATSGYVYLDNDEIYDNPIAVKKRIGYMPENISLYNEMRVYDYLSFSTNLKGVPKNNKKSAISNSIELTGLEEYSNRLIGHLSKGYRQRVGLAQAIINDPDVLILDEPTSGLDPSQLVEIRALIKSLGGSRTVILSTHILSEVEETCERALIIDNGKLIAEDTIEGLKQKMDEEILGGNLLIKVIANQEEAASAIREIPNVIQVHLDNSFNIIVEVERGINITPKIVKYLVDKNFEILDVHPTKRTLEEVFIYFTERGSQREANREVDTEVM